MKTFSKKTVSVLLSLAMMFGMMTVTTSSLTVPDNDALYKQVSEIYEKALALDRARRGVNITNFNSLCSHYVHLQLMLLGVNSGYIGVNGNDAFDLYKNKQYSSGGYRIHAYPATQGSIADALRAISVISSTATNILVGFQATMTSAGKRYGHVMLIHGIINGYVYFTDNSSIKIDGKIYPAGSPIRCSIDAFQANYGRPEVYTYEGIIWFENETLTSMVQNGETGTVETPIEEPVQPKVYTTGSYRVTYPGGLRIREQATTGSPTLEILPKGYCAYVTEVKNEWGKIFCSYNGNIYDGWFCLTYTEKVSDLPLISSDVYDNGNLVFQEWYTSLTEAVNDSADSAVIVLHANCKITENLFLKEKQTIDMGPYEITASGNVSFCLNNGTVKSDKGSRFMNDNPFVSVKQVGGRYVYSSKTTCEPVSVSFGLSRLPKMRFKINIKSVVEGAEYNAVFSISDDASYESTGFTVEGNCVYISTPELPFDVLGDAVMVSPEMHKTINGIEYVSKEEPFLCNIPVVLSGQIWNGKFGDVAASLLNFVTEVQKTNGVNSSNYANRFLPSKKKVLGDVNIVSGNIPSVSFDNKSLSMIVEKSGDYDILLVSKEKSPLNSGQLKDSTYKVDLTGDKFIFSEFAVRNSFDTYYFTFAKYDGRQYICGETMEVIPISYISGDNSFIKAYAQYAGALSEYFG